MKVNGEWSIASGQSLFEVVFALGVAAIVLVGIVALAASAVRNTSFSRNRSLATRYLQEAAEWLRKQRDTDWGNFFNNRSSGGGTVWCLNQGPLSSWPGSSGDCGGGTITGTIFTREATLTRYNISPTVVGVRANVIVSWQDAQGGHEVRTVTNFSAWPTQ